MKIKTERRRTPQKRGTSKIAASLTTLTTPATIIKGICSGNRPTRTNNTTRDRRPFFIRIKRQEIRKVRNILDLLCMHLTHMGSQLLSYLGQVKEIIDKKVCPA